MLGGRGVSFCGGGTIGSCVSCGKDPVFKLSEDD